MSRELYDKLKEYKRKDIYPFHMPGHKRNMEQFADIDANVYDMDITEINDFDDLHHAEGIIKEVQIRAARLYGSDAAYLCVNGSTGGILSAVFAAATQGGKILMARNCHKSVYHGVFLRELDALYSYPQIHPEYGVNCGIDPEEIESMWKLHPDIQALVITSPTYEGIVSDIERIAEIVHRNNGILIVDEAHGAHFGFHDEFPRSAVTQGADIVIQSLHKTLPALTQSALVHVNETYMDKSQVKRYLEIFQTSSPSYILMSSMDYCLSLIEQDGKALFNQYILRLKRFQEEVKGLKHIQLMTERIAGCYNIESFDPSKIVLSIKNRNFDGKWLSQELREQNLEMEMESPSYVVGMTSIMDTEEGFQRLAAALHMIDRRMDEKPDADREIFCAGRNEICMKISEAFHAGKKKVRLCESQNEIAAEYVYLYPPGIPLIAPGERIDRNIIDFIETCRNRGYVIQGMEDYSLASIQVVQQGKELG